MQVDRPAFFFYNIFMKYQLSDVEIKIHDARRRVEGLLNLIKMDCPLPEEEFQNLQHDLAEAQRLMINCYLEFMRSKEEEKETLNNVVEFPNKKEE